MIVAAYAGCGKTTFAREVWNSIDNDDIASHKYDMIAERKENNGSYTA